MEWLAQKSTQPHRTLIGRKTLDALSGIPEAYQDDEGVETDEQLALLHDSHCDEIQGHHFSKLIKSKAIEDLLRSQNAVP
ncbi:hypothetical protein EB230_29510 [Mesorhizobium sp. NZP2234]|uniref:hypothetical protein n=1 Tax=Mesorhizobium sp. NZP2234 TaxID=2483402 RepID=UPI001556991F|nr:hypothetical protein [Mesorhizobium sp. NZP2234]QKC92079.1 hypothetical protein EB230_29510 [Mesorhizobium sp. NZP2234]